MGASLKVYFLYRLSEEKFLLLRVDRPPYNNADQGDADRADELLELKKTIMLQKFLEKNQLKLKPEFIGAFQGLPEGDVFYGEKGSSGLKDLWYASTRFGKLLARKILLIMEWWRMIFFGLLTALIILILLQKMILIFQGLIKIPIMNSGPLKKLFWSIDY